MQSTMQENHPESLYVIVYADALPEPQGNPAGILDSVVYELLDCAWNDEMGFCHLRDALEEEGFDILTSMKTDKYIKFQAEGKEINFKPFKSLDAIVSMGFYVEENQARWEDVFEDDCIENSDIVDRENYDRAMKLVK